jgi:hypothetical protein
MSLNPPKATHVGQVWVDPITAESFVWMGPKPGNDYWAEWAPLKPSPKMTWEEAAAIENEQYRERNPESD